MKRWPVLVSFFLFLALCASLAAWSVQWFQPPRRQLAAAPVPPPEAAAAVQLTAASTLFGSRKATVAPATNYALRGVIVARRADQGFAIIAIDGKPAQAVRAGADVVAGVSVKEVHPQFVLLSERGAERRLELFERKTGEMLARLDTPTRVSAGEARTASPTPAVSSDALPAERPRNRRGRGEDLRTPPE